MVMRVVGCAARPRARAGRMFSECGVCVSVAAAMRENTNTRVQLFLVRCMFVACGAQLLCTRTVKYCLVCIL